MLQSPSFFTLYLSPLRWQTPYTDWETWPCSCILIYFLAACIEFLSSEIHTRMVIAQPICFQRNGWFRFFCTVSELQWNNTSPWDSTQSYKARVCRFCFAFAHLDSSQKCSLVYFCNNILTELWISIMLFEFTHTYRLYPRNASIYF